jgi:hypothetical protein
VPSGGVDHDGVGGRGGARRPARGRDEPGSGADASAAAALAPPDRSWWRPARWLRGRSLHPPALPLEWAAGAVGAAYVQLGELSAEAAASLTFGARPDGWVRVALPAAGVEESRRFSAALDELLGGGPLPRYVVSRRARAGAGPVGRTRLVWHPVPGDLARRRDRAEAFHAAWRRWAGPGELVYAHGDDPRGPALAAQALGASALETQRRRIWR